MLIKTRMYDFLPILIESSSVASASRLTSFHVELDFSVVVLSQHDIGKHKTW